MNYDYDEYYKKENYFGKPYELLVDFFTGYEPKGHVLDIGCGQGRDSIMLGKLGYKVTGIDVSAVGINQMNREAEKLHLDVRGLVNDMDVFSITDNYDIILMDSMLHFYKNDIKRETWLVKKILYEMKYGAVFVNCMVSGKKREKIFRETIQTELCSYDILLDSYAMYPDYNSEYHIYIIRKTGGAE